MNRLTQDHTVPSSPDLLNSRCATPLGTLKRGHFAERKEGLGDFSEVRF